MRLDLGARLFLTCEIWKSEMSGDKIPETSAEGNNGLTSILTARNSITKYSFVLHCVYFLRTEDVLFD